MGNRGAIQLEQKGEEATWRLPSLVAGVSSAVMERVREARGRDEARLEPQEVDMVSPWELRLLSVDMGLLEPSCTLWKMLCVTCTHGSADQALPHTLSCLPAG